MHDLRSSLAFGDIVLLKRECALYKVAVYQAKFPFSGGPSRIFHDSVIPISYDVCVIVDQMDKNLV